MPCTSSCRAALTISPTERLCPRWMTSTPLDCKIRRMILIEASCPSKSAAAVMKRIFCFAVYGCSCLLSERSVIGAPRGGRAHGRTRCAGFTLQDATAIMHNPPIPVLIPSKVRNLAHTSAARSRNAPCPRRSTTFARYGRDRLRNRLAVGHGGAQDPLRRADRSGGNRGGRSRRPACAGADRKLCGPVQPGGGRTGG